MFFFFFVLNMGDTGRKVLRPAMDRDVKQKKSEYLKAGYTRRKRLSDITTVTLWAVLTLLYWARMASNWHSGEAVSMALGFVLSLVVTDMFAGLVHWACDTWGDVQGPYGFLIRGFREHHVDEKAMTRHDFIEVSGSSSLGATIVLLLAHALTDFSAPDRSPAGLVALHCLGWFVVFATITNQVHKWSHMPLQCPQVVRTLQRYRMLLNPKDHAYHHTMPHDTYYCIFNGWMNPVLSTLGFWRGFEFIITALTGVQPRQDDFSWVSNDLSTLDSAPVVQDSFYAGKKD
jgi:hypothetical protein